MADPTQAQIDDFTKKVQMNLDFGHYIFIDEHVTVFMNNTGGFSPLYILAFLRTAYSKREMLKTYSHVLEYARNIFSPDQLAGLD